MNRLPPICTRAQALEQVRSDWQFGNMLTGMLGDSNDLAVFRTNTWLQICFADWSVEELEHIRKPYTEVERWNADI